MIEETGTVVELKEQGVAVVRCTRNSACDHCPSSGSCNMGNDGETMLVDVRNDIGAPVGAEVRVVTSTGNFLRSSFVLYIIPVIGLLVGALVGQSVAEDYAISIDSSLLSAIMAVVFMAASFLVIRIWTRRLDRAGFMPRITEIL